MGHGKQESEGVPGRHAQRRVTQAVLLPRLRCPVLLLSGPSVSGVGVFPDSHGVSECVAAMRPSFRRKSRGLGNCTESLMEGLM